VILSRDQLLEIMRSPRFHIDEGRRTEVRVVAVGEESAVVTDRWHGSGIAPDGATFADDHRCTFVWARRGGRWKLLLEQCTAIAR
jgi:ketosteroid isomerase-like protein